MRVRLLITSWHGRVGLLLAAFAGLLPRLAQAQSTRSLIRLDLLGSGSLSDQTHVYFQTGATAGFDPSFDASKLSNPSGLNIASVMSTQQYAINGLPPLTSSPLSVLLFVGVPAYGTYRIQVGQFDNLTRPAVWLRDAQLNTRTRLALGTTYTLIFTNTYTAANRLYLEFDALTPTALPAGGGAVTQPAVWPNPAHGSFSLRLPGTGPATVTVLDALGRSVRTLRQPQHPAAAVLRVDVQGLAAGAYVVRVQAAEAPPYSMPLLLE